MKPPQKYSVRAVLLATSYWNGKLEWIKFILFAKLSLVKFHLLGAKVCCIAFVSVFLFLFLYNLFSFQKFYYF